jgi:tetratricopeptide (TPR) repeat protein
VTFLDVQLCSHQPTRRTLKRATVVDSDNSEVWYHLGMTYQREKEYEQAAAAFRRGILVDPTEAGAHRELGRALWGQGELVEAEKSVKTPLQIDDTDAWASRLSRPPAHPQGRSGRWRIRVFARPPHSRRTSLCSAVILATHWVSRAASTMLRRLINTPYHHWARREVSAHVHVQHVQRCRYLAC